YCRKSAFTAALPAVRCNCKIIFWVGVSPAACWVGPVCPGCRGWRVGARFVLAVLVYACDSLIVRTLPFDFSLYTAASRAIRRHGRHIFRHVFRHTFPLPCRVKAWYAHPIPGSVPME